MTFGRVDVSGGFLLLLAWMNYLDRQNLLPLTLAACVLHELGHILAIRLMGGRVVRLQLSAAGAALVLAAPMGYLHELLSAAAGPAVNLLLACIFCRAGEHALFVGINLALAAFNLLPVGQLDGGRILSCLLSMFLGPQDTDRILSVLDHTLIVLLFSIGAFLFCLFGNGTMLMVSVWLGTSLFNGKKREIGLAIRNRNG